MNKNKSHLYALMIHQANSSWLKSLTESWGTAPATMPQHGQVWTQPSSASSIKLILGAEDRSLNVNIRIEHTYQQCVYWSRVGRVGVQAASMGTREPWCPPKVTLRETQQETFPTWGKKLPGTITASADTTVYKTTRPKTTQGLLLLVITATLVPRF